jgi:glyoxylate/hydroxypyruvate reductase A
MALNVLIASPLEPELVERIGRVDGRLNVLYQPELLPVARYPADHTGTRRQLDERQRQVWLRMLGDSDISFDFDWLAPDEMKAHSPNLKWVQATSSGIGEFLRRTGLAKSDIVFTNAAGVHAQPLAEHVLLGLLFLSKNVPDLLRRQRDHDWERYATTELSSLRVLVVGLGAVGRRVAELLNSVGCDVWATVRHPRPAPPSVSRIGMLQDLRPFLPEVDAVVVSSPLTESTHHLFSDDQFAAMKESAWIVNIGRGAIIDESALIRALMNRQIGGAVLDVFEDEPLKKASPLWDLPNVLITPHSASTVPGENSRIVDIFEDNLRRYLAGAPLRNVFDVNP